MAGDSGVTVDMTANAAIATVGLGRRFGPVVAVDHVSLCIPTGTVCGLLGPNGAGKTTVLRIVTTLLRPDHGSALLFGQPARRSAPVLARVGAAIDQPAFYPYLSGRANLEVFSLLRVRRPDAGRPIGAALERLDLSAAADRRVGTYSTGMRQRLAIALAIVGSPELVILDEPTSGLDPEGVVIVRDLIRELTSSGVTVVLSSHQLGEVERLCSWLSVMAHGRLVAQGSVDDLLGDAVVHVSLASVAEWRIARDVLASADLGPRDADGSSPEPAAPTLVMTTPTDDPRAISRLLAAHGVYPTEVALRRRSLESFYLESTTGGAQANLDGAGPAGA